MKKIKTLITYFILIGLLSLTTIFITKNLNELKNNLSKIIFNKTQNKSVQQQEAKQISVIPTLPNSPETFTFSHGEKVKGPRVSSITFSPLRINPNSPQNISAVFPEKEIVKKATLFFNTDNYSNQKVELSRALDAPNIWSGSWTPIDTADTNYSVLLQFVGSGTYQEVMKIL